MTQNACVEDGGERGTMVLDSIRRTAGSRISRVNIVVSTGCPSPSTHSWSLLTAVVPRQSSNDLPSVIWSHRSLDHTMVLDEMEETDEMLPPLLLPFHAKLDEDDSTRDPLLSCGEPSLGEMRIAVSREWKFGRSCRRT